MAVHPYNLYILYTQVHYTGLLAKDGSKFDSSYDRSQPLDFTVGQGMVIQGWDKGIGGYPGIDPLKVGGKRILYIPASMGYGARGAGGVIPPNADLVFEVELVAISGGEYESL